MKFGFLLVLVVLLAACSDFKKGNQLDSLNALQQSLDSINTVLIENKVEPIENILTETIKIDQRIKENFNGDTIDFEFGKKLDRYKKVRSTLEPLKKANQQLVDNIAKVQASIENLSDDIQNGNGQRGRYQEFVDFERKKVQDIRELLSAYVVNRNKSIDEYKEIEEEVKAFSMQLLSNN